MKKGTVLKAFPFNFDGINITHNAAYSTFPPDGFQVADSAFDGLVAAGYIKATEGGDIPPEEDLNRRIIESIDRHLSAVSDQELKDIIARSGKPYSGNMVHAHLVFAAKTQLQAEMAGAKPVFGIDPNSGVTEQPRAKPGEATPPSAAAAVEQQKAQADAAKGDNSARLEDAKRVDAPAKAASEANLDELTVAELKELAEKRGVNLGDATKKNEIVDAIKAADKK